MANVIKIKRSATTATPASLAEGELAYSENSDNLFIGTNGGVDVTKIGGQADVAKLAGVEAGAQVNTVDSVAGKTGVVTLVKGDVGLGSVDNTADADKPVSTAQQTEIDTKLDLAGGTLTGALTLSGDPTNALHAATKQYVDAVAIGLDVKASVRASTTANITLSGEQTIDGVAVVAGDRVLVKDQTTGSENGIYVASLTGWSRAEDADTSAEVTSGMFTFVEEGTTQSTSGWVLQTSGSITLGTTALVFAQFTGGSSYSAGSGIDITGSVISVADLAGEVITSGTVADARLSANVLLNTTAIDGGSF
jgi:hypothetical protein